jgi:hypothetical protein
MIDTATAREDSGHRIRIPVDKRLVAHRVHESNDLFHDMAIIDCDIIQIFRNIGDRVDMDAIFSIPVGEVRDVFEFPFCLECP